MMAGGSNRVEVRRTSAYAGGRLALAAVCIAFGILVIVLDVGAITKIIIGGGMIALGIVTAINARTIMANPVAYAVSEVGIEIEPHRAGGLVQWNDIEDIGIVTVGKAKSVGVRLSSAERFLASASPRSAGNLTGVRLASMIPGAKLGAFSQVTDLSSLLRTNQRTYGYHLTLGGPGLDRSPEDMAELIRSRAGGRASSNPP